MAHARFFQTAAIWLAVSGGAAALLLGSFSAAQLHGFVEPCRVEFIEDQNTECQVCVPSSSQPDLCERQWGDEGYHKRCQTGPHSAPGEVWCISRSGSRFATPIVLSAAALSFAGLAYVFWRRRPAK